MEILMNNFSNKYKERVQKTERSDLHMENAIVQKFWEQPFNKAINLNKLQSILMESYVEAYTGKFKMHNNQNIYFTSNLHEMLENVLMLIQRKQVYFSSINLNSQTPACVITKKSMQQNLKQYL